MRKGKCSFVTPVLFLALAFATAVPSLAQPDEHSVARVWDETLLDAIRSDRPKPPVHSRNLFHLSVAMWDAWAAYDDAALGYISIDKYDPPGDGKKNIDQAIEAARREAISYAAFRLLNHRFPGTGFDPIDGSMCQPGAAESLADFAATLQALGYDPSFTSTVGDSPAAVGNRIGQAVIDYGLTDNAEEGFDLCYPDFSGYTSENPEMIFKRPGTNAADADRWQPLAFDELVLQNGIIIGTAVQSFVGVNWGATKSFSIPPVPAGDLPDPVDCGNVPAALSPIFDPGCAPQLGGAGDAEMKAAIVELIEFSGSTDPTDGATIDLSPGKRGNNPLGTDDGTGHPVNPITHKSYPSNVVKYGDWARVISEFWADGPESETPPGHWNTLANYVTDHPDLGRKRLGGAGRELTDLEWDVKLYLVLNGAVHDAAIAAWGTKHYYDSSRPITLIRYAGGLGQSSEPSGPSYHPDGLPLEPGFIEVMTAETIAAGGKHEQLSAFCAGGGLAEGEPCVTDSDCPDDGALDGFCDSSEGKIAIYAWRGEPDDPATEIGGAGWIRAIDWMPYQASNFVTPPFPGYTSGHSTFSRAAAEVLAEFTGSPYFPGGLGSFVAEEDEFLAFENGPSETIALQWATYADAADEAGLSRRYGGIHPWFDDYPGRVQGYDIGQAAFLRGADFFSPTVCVCHVPPGNPSRAKTICVGAKAAVSHIKQHGDTMGECSQADPRTAGNSLRSRKRGTRAVAQPRFHGSGGEGRLRALEEEH